MSLLELERVSKRRESGAAGRVALREVCLELEPGELVVVWGRRRSGRSTLLRVAAGLEAPDTGVVRFTGHDLAGRAGQALRGGIGHCSTVFRPDDGRCVVDQVMLGLIARGLSPSAGMEGALGALERAGVAECAQLRPGELDGGEAARVAIARSLALRPSLLVIDEPTLGVDLLARDGILLLLRSIADEGMAVLASTGETTGLAGADRALSLGDGQLRGTLSPRLAPVVPLRGPVRPRASA